VQMLAVTAGEVWSPASDALRFAKSASRHTPPTATDAGGVPRFLKPKTKRGDRRLSRILWNFYFDAPHRTAGHVGLGRGLMSQSAARLKSPA
jgi:hypothetical protein